MLGLTFNGKRNNRIYLLEGRRKPPFAPRQHNLLTGKYISRVQQTRTAPLTIQQPVGFVVKDNQDALVIRDVLASWLITDEPVALSFDDEPGRTYFALVDNTIEDFERFSVIRRGTIQFLCPDGHGYGLTKTINVGTGYATHNVTGQVPSTWSSRTVFSSETVNYTLENDRGGKVLLNYTFGANDVLEINYEKRLIKLNGVARMPLLSLDSNWFKLLPGTNRLRASQTTVVTYRETYY